MSTDKNKVVRRLLGEKCIKCNNSLAEDDHTCPYKEEIDNDLDSFCNCCNKCMETCADDI